MDKKLIILLCIVMAGCVGISHEDATKHCNQLGYEYHHMDMVRNFYCIDQITGLIYGFDFGYINSLPTQQSELINIKLIAVVQENGKDTQYSFESELICNLTNKRCGNNVNYNEGKGFYWLGLNSASGLHLNAYLMDNATN